MRTQSTHIRAPQALKAVFFHVFLSFVCEGQGRPCKQVQPVLEGTLARALSVVKEGAFACFADIKERTCLAH